MQLKIAISYENKNLISCAKQLSEELHLPIAELNPSEFPVLLILREAHLELKLTEKITRFYFVDFLQGPLAHRRQHGGGKNQLIAKAIGIKSKQKIAVLDVTAGLGRDAFVLSTLGCDVVMCERSPIIYALLRDGLLRASNEIWFQKLSLQLKILMD